MKMNKKLIVATAACAALLVGSISTSLAWLMDNTDAVTNEFTTSTIGVDLKETTTSYKMIPGWDIAKDPEAWVTTGSEDAFLFVEVTESDDFDTFMTYKIADGWTLLSDDTKTGGTIDTVNNDTYVIYRTVTSTQIGTHYDVLAGDKVTVNGEVTKAQMDAFDTDKNGTLSDEEKKALPKLSFTAYAHQLYQSEGNAFTADAAWGHIK